ncbi:hypothetical protein BST61_g10243 [Cercospora zeina]
MAPVPRQAREQRRQKPFVRHERRVAFLRANDDDHLIRQVNEIHARVLMLRNFRQRMDRKCRLLEEEYQLVQGMRDMAETVEAMERGANEMWQDQEIDDWHFRPHGENAAREDDACRGCGLMDEAQGHQNRHGNVRGVDRRARVEEVDDDYPPAYVEGTPPAGDLPRQTRSSGRRGHAVETTVQVGPGSALDEQDDHSAYVMMDDTTEHDIPMSEGSGGPAQRRRSRRRKARVARPRPNHVSASAEAE